MMKRLRSAAQDPCKVILHVAQSFEDWCALVRDVFFMDLRVTIAADTQLVHGVESDTPGRCDPEVEQ